jgi:hypothetical protein
MVLQAHSKKYRRQTSISMDVNQRHSGGVMVLSGNPPAQQTITHPAPLPVLEILDAESEKRPRDDAEPSADEPDANEQHEAEPVAASPPAEPPTPSAPSPATSHGPLSPLVADLLRRAAMKPDDPERSAPPAKPSDNIGPVLSRPAAFGQLRTHHE